MFKTFDSPKTFTVLGVFAGFVFVIIAAPVLCVIISIMANAVLS